MKKPVIITIISLVILALVGGGVFWYLKQGKQTVNPLVTENEPGQTASSTTKNIDTSDWVTYQNKEYGFEFKYPEQYIAQDVTKSITEDSSNNAWYQQPGYLLNYTELNNVKSKNKLLIFKLLNTTNELQIESSGGWEFIKKIKDEVINNNIVKIFAIDKGNQEICAIINNEKSYTFFYDKNKVDNNLLSKIISTLEFSD